MAEISSRCWELTTKLIHPETGNTLIELDKIDKTLKNFPQLDSYSWIVHDKDKNADGTPIEPHIHLLMNFTNAQKLSPLAKAFNFEDNPNFFQKKTNGRGKPSAYLDCLIYLTHEDKEQQKLGKHLYSDDEVHFWHVNGQEFREYINTKKQSIKDKIEKYGDATISKQDEILMDIRKFGVSLKQAAKKSEKLFCKYEKTYLKARLRYLTYEAKAPEFRMNIYIQGTGGVGKRICSTSLARLLVNASPETPDNDVFFEVGASNTTFEGYDGQPVIIWNDCRAPSLIKKLGDIDNVYNTFDTFPPDMRQNVKGSSVVLRNKFNIINCYLPWEEFLDELAGEYKLKDGSMRKAEDKNQARRRFPFIVTLFNNNLDILINKGFYEGTRDFEQWYHISCIHGNCRDIKTKISDPVLADSINLKLLKPIIEAIEKKKADFTKKDYDESSGYFDDFGTKTELTLFNIIERFEYFVRNYRDENDSKDINTLFEEFYEKNNLKLTLDEIEVIINSVESTIEESDGNSLPNKIIPAVFEKESGYKPIAI